jgi:hypothetical protein
MLSTHHPGAARVVERALFALRAGITGLERLMTHLNLLGAGVGVGPVVAVPFPFARCLGIVLGVGLPAR